MTSGEGRELELIIGLAHAHYEDDCDGFDSLCSELSSLYRASGRDELADWVEAQVRDAVAASAV